MAAAGGVAAAGGGGGGFGGGGGGGFGGGLGEEDIPDVRFLKQVPKILGKSKTWVDGNANSEWRKDITPVDKEKIFTDLLRSYGYGEDELTISYQVSETLDRQPQPFPEMNWRACGLLGSAGRKRRRCIFLMILIHGYPQFSKLPNFPKQYRNPRQLSGDLNSVKESLESVWVEFLSVCAQIRGAGGDHVDIPEVFKKDIQLHFKKKKN